MDKDKLIVVLLLFVFALFLFYQGFFKLAIISPYVEVYIEAIKIGSSSYAPITSWNLPIFRDYDKWIDFNNKPSTASKWESISGNGYVIYKFDPDSQMEGLPNLEVELRIVGEEEKLIYNETSGKAETIVFNYILCIERISADYTEIGGVRFYGAERYGKYVNSFVRIVLSSPYLIEEIYDGGNLVPPSYVRADKREVKFEHVIESEAPDVFEKTYYSLFVIRCNKNIPLTPKTTIRITDTKTIPTTLVSYSTVVKPYTITATKEVIIYETTTVIGGTTKTITTSTIKQITYSTTYTELKPYTITVNLGPGTIITVTETVTTTTGGFEIPDWLKDLMGNTSILIIGAGVAIVIIAYLLKRRRE
jgi:hypothetical protein